MRIKNHFALLFLLYLFTPALAQKGLITSPKASLELKIEQDEGNNGTAVVYNPEKRCYYTAFAGNRTFPLETFGSSGQPLAQHETGYDLRGMWWNKKAGSLEGNCFADGGMVKLGLNVSGYPSGKNAVIYDNSGQPDQHAVGIFDPKKKEILYFSEGYIRGISRKNGTASKTEVVLSLPVSTDNLNQTTPIFTQKKKMEIGLLDVQKKKVYLFNRKNGAHTGTVNLPSDAVVNEFFNWSFANGYIFLYDKNDRVWRGYQIFAP
jgi:hypothetical protein